MRGSSMLGAILMAHMLYGDSSPYQSPGESFYPKVFEDVKFDHKEKPLSKKQRRKLGIK